MAEPVDHSTDGALLKCRNCDGPMESPVFCDHCRRLYPAEGLTYFALLGVPVTFDLDPAELRQKYLQVSRGVHPDRQGASGDATSLRLSAELNEAHRVLADPALRAEYLLELMGGQAATDDRSVPQDVLAATMLLREEVAEAKAAGDDAALEMCRGRAQTTHDDTLNRIAELAHKLPGDETLRRELRSTLNAIKYHKKVLAEL